MTLDESMRIRVPEAMTDAVKQAAERCFLSSSSYVRQAVAERLRRDGVDLPKLGAQSAGAERDG